MTATNPRAVQAAGAYCGRYGLAITWIPRGQKGPTHLGWNQPGGYITSAEEAKRHWFNNPSDNMGVVLGPSGLCSLDVDDVEHTRAVLAEFGIDIDAMAQEFPTVVGNPERFRILFSAPQGVTLSRHALAWPRRSDPAKQFTLFELRAGPVQDVLPPSIHPGTGKEYEWRTKPNGEFPKLPAPLLTLWRDWQTFEGLAKSLCPWAPYPTPHVRPRSGESVIDSFNAAHHVTELLERHGYKPDTRGNRYLAPASESGLAGVVILDEGKKCYSHHGADPLADGHSHDAFDVYRILDHGGDVGAAAKAAAEVLGLARTPTSGSPTTSPGQTAESAKAAAPGIIVRRVSDIAAEPIKWLWPGRIARGKASDISGDPGLGKSQITISIAAVVTRGGQWPVDRSRCERGSAIFLSAEDGVADTIRPRLEAAGADLDRCHVIEAVRDGFTADGREMRRTFDLRRDLSHLEGTLKEMPDAALVVIDPVSAYLGGTDSHNNADVRGLLAPLHDIANRFGVAVLTVNHLNKGSGPAIRRVNGSIGFVAAARAAFVVAADPEDPSRRLFLPSKNNNAKDQGGLAYRLESHTLPGGIETSRIMWEGAPVGMTADDALATARDNDERSALEEAKDFLRGLLADGPVMSKLVRSNADGAGHQWRTVERASRAIGVETYRKGGLGKDGVWWWKLCAGSGAPPEPAVPLSPPKPTISANAKGMADLGKLGGLSDPERTAEAF